MDDDADTLSLIGAKLDAAGVSHDRDALAYVLDGIFKKYADYRELTSRDSMPTGPELTVALGEVYDHLEAIALLCTQNIHVAVWLDEFAKDLPADDPLPGRFSTSLVSCLRAARDAHEHFQNATGRDEPLVVQRDAAAVEHRKRTRTESRDTVLIPSLVSWLHIAGLHLKEDDGRWNLEAVDAACEIIALILGSQGVPVPAAGDTNTPKGEANQGRLRRMVKDTWTSLEPALTKNRPESPA